LRGYIAFQICHQTGAKQVPNWKRLLREGYKARSKIFVTSTGDRLKPMSEANSRRFVTIVTGISKSKNNKIEC
jgi:hypothetical protein